MAKFCAWCGKPLEDGDVFCGWCGRRADGSDAAPAAPEAPAAPAAPEAPAAPAAPEAPAAPAAPAAPQQPQWQQTPTQPPRQPQWQQAPAQPQQQPQWQQAPAAVPPSPRPKGGGKGVIIGVVALVLVLAVGVGGFVWPGFFKKDGGEVEKPAPHATEKPASTKVPKPADIPKATEAPKATGAPKATLAPKPVETPAPTPEPTPEPTPYQNPFTDVKESDWYYAAVMWAGERGILSGTEFSPKKEANRAQALTFLWRAAGEPEPSLKVSPYTDVKESDYFFRPVLWGFENGLVSTAKDAQFHPNDSLTRAQALTFISRAVGGTPKGTARSFADVTPDKWYFDTANWALENGVVGRDDNWAFYPDETVTRAQYVTFMHRAMDPAAQKADTVPPGNWSFPALGITENVDDHGVKTFNTFAQNGDAVTFTAEVTDYEVFEEADGYPLVEGYEYRVMTVHIYTKNADYGRTYLVRTINNDYYNIGLYEDSEEEDDSGVLYHTVVMNGVPAETTVWDAYDFENVDGYIHVDYTWTASVPKGYDGQVVGFRNANIDISGLYLDQYYTGEDDFALYRMN